MNSGIILMAGKGIRSGLEYNKNLFEYLGYPLFMHSVKALSAANLDEIILVIDKEDEEEVLKYVDENIIIVYGSDTRTNSLKEALKVTKGTKVIVHDAARPKVTADDIKQMIKTLDQYDLASFYHPVVDTIKDGIKTLNRDNLKAVSTPQGFTKKCFEYILKNEQNVFDELQIFENMDFNIGFIQETHDNKKFTTKEDFENQNYLIGHSKDFHKLVDNRSLVLGGITIDYPQGLLGHSDADVVYHAVAEAIIGALGLGDLGTLYPDTDVLYLGIESSYFLKDVSKKLKEKSYEINNIDVIIYLEEPNLKTHKKQMAKNIAENLNTKESLINVKATTMEKCGIIGSKEGIMAEAIVLLKKVK